MKSRLAGLAARPGMLMALAVGLMLPGCEGPEIDSPIPRFAETSVQYPVELWYHGVEGTTMVRVLVNELGGVDSAMVAESSGIHAMDSAAVQGALGMEFEPARIEGEPVKVWARVPIHFRKPEADAGAARNDTGGPDTTSGPESGVPHDA